jgi:hypothetical protein
LSEEADENKDTGRPQPQERGIYRVVGAVDNRTDSGFGEAHSGALSCRLSKMWELVIGTAL